MKICTVQRGDTLRSIAQRFGVRCDALIKANGLENTAMLAVGQTLLLPCSSAPPGRSVLVNGYVTQYIPKVLDETLPYLSFVSPFAYHAEACGGLTAHGAFPALQGACGTAELLTITNQTPEGIFSAQIAHTLITDESAQRQLFQNIASLLHSDQWYGVNLSFAYLYAFDRTAYTHFIARLAEFLHRLGAIFVTTLPPICGNTYRDPLASAFDYAALGKSADYIILLSYDWGHRCSPPMAIAPLDKVHRLLSYACTQIPPNKLLLSIPNYGLDWTLPFQFGQYAKPIRNDEAVILAATVGAEIRLCSASSTPYYRYLDSEGVQHEIWFEDARSLLEKYCLVSVFDLGGLSFWNLDRCFSTNSLLLEKKFILTKLI